MSGTLRFAVVATPAGDGRAWARLAADLEAQGWDALLVPDTLATPSPFPALAAAAAVTERIRLRTWVLAAPLRTAAATVREVRALQELGDGRFDAGLGTGRPHAEHEAAALGIPWPPAAGRIQRVLTTVAALRADVRPAPPVTIAASGPRMLVAAAAVLTGPDDRVGLALPPAADEAALSAAVDRLHEAAGRSVRGSLQLVSVGGQVSAAFARWAGPDAAGLSASRAVAVLPPDPGEALAVLQERADRWAIDEVVVPADLTEAAAPLLERAR